LNTTYPYTQLKNSESPNFYNVRLYARNATDRRVAVGTRKGPGFYSVPVGETADTTQTSTTGAADQTVTDTTWLAGKYVAGATGRLTKVDLNIKKGTSPTQHLLVSLYSGASAPTTLLATSSILSSSTTSSYQYLTARFIEAPQVTNGTTYWIVVHMQSGGTGSYNWSSTTTATTALSSANSGGSWSATSYELDWKTWVATDAPFLGGIRYTPSNATANTVIAANTDVYTVSEVDGSLTSIKSSLSSSATEYNFAQSNDILYYCNGHDAPRQWDGTTESAVTNAPVTSQFIIFHKNRMWLVDSTNPTKLWFSDLGDYTTWTSTNFIYAPAPKSGDPITGLETFQDNLIVFTRKTKYVLFGEDPGNFILRQSSGKKGAVNQATIKSDPNYIYFLSDDGVYRYNGSTDELMSDPIQTEIDNMSDRTMCAAVVHNNYYRLYYAKIGSTKNDSCIIWDTLNKFWLRDSNTYIDRPFVGETNILYEGSSVIGAVMKAEQAYSDMGKPIDFIYWTKAFGDGLHELFLRRVIPSIRLQTQLYSLNMYIDTDQRNTNSIVYSLPAQASGETWGGGTTWGDGTTWGSATVSTPDPKTGSDGYWHQIRFEQNGVDTPVELLSYILQVRNRRLR
jgi:hypothetical protein